MLQTKIGAHETARLIKPPREVIQVRNVSVTSRADLAARIREAQRAWFQKVLEKSGETPTGVARASGLTPATLTRFWNDPEYAGRLDTLTVMQVENWSGIAAPADARGMPDGFAEEGAIPYLAAGDESPLGKAVRALIAGRKGVETLELKTRSLEDAGVLPGDIIVFQPGRPAGYRDLVCAQVYEAGGATTIWRRYDKPYLTDLTRDPALRRDPEIADDKRVFIQGVITEVVRRFLARNQ